MATGLLQRFVIVLLATLIFIIIPVFLLLSLPTIIIRYFIGKSAKFLNPTLGKIVTARGSLFACDDLFDNPVGNIVGTNILQGNMNISSIREIFKTKVLKHKLPNGELAYPEVKQYLTSWAGYFFWKDDKTFKLENHFKLYEKCGTGECGRYSEGDIHEIRQELLVNKWNRNHPLWEVIVINNYYPAGANIYDPQSIIFCRFHHSLGDGYSCLYMLVKRLFECEDDAIPIATPNYPKRGFFSKIFNFITFPFSVSYSIAEYILLFELDLPWRNPAEGGPNKPIVDLAHRIPLSKVKGIKNHFNVSFTSVIFAILTGAKRNMLIKSGNKCPSRFPLSIAMPLPGHTDKLRNYMTGGVVNLPLSEPDPVKRLQLCHQNYEDLKQSKLPIILTFVPLIAGSFFPAFFRGKGNPRRTATTACLTNFPTGDSHYYFDGHKILELMVCVGIPSSKGVIFCAMSYTDGIRIAPVGNSSVFTKEELRDLTNLIEKEVDALHQLVIA